MNKLLKLAEKIVISVEEKRISLWILFSSFVSLIIIRILIENLAVGNNAHKSLLIFYEFFDSFGIALLLSLWIVHKILRIDFRKAANVLVLGYSIIIIPPLVDWVMSHGKGFLSFYTFDGLLGLIGRYFTFFGDRPDVGITYGVRAEILAAILLLFFYAFIRSKNIFKSLLASLLTYSVLFVLGTFPSWIAIAAKGISEGFLNITGIDAVQMFFSPFVFFSREITMVNDALITKVNVIYILILSAILLIGFWKYQKEKFYSFLGNIRIPQILYHLGLLLVGLGAGIIFSGTDTSFNFFNTLGFLVLSEAVIFSWLASVVANDIVDEKIDFISNPQRPLIKKSFSISEYKNLGLIFFSLSIYLSFLINPKITFLLIAYQAIAWVYSSWPLRLKRFAFISTFVSALASTLIFFSGYILISPSGSLSQLPASIVIFLIFAYTFSLPIKDFKDIEGDRADGVYTVPVVFGEHWGKIIIGSGILISFLASVLVFNEFRLFWWALVLGGISFWLVNKMRPSDPAISFLEIIKNPKRLLSVRITYGNIFWWIMVAVSLYGLMLVKTILL